MFFDDAVADRESQAGAATCGFGGEEGVEDAREIFALDAEARVGDFDFDVAVIRGAAHFEHAAGRHGVLGIQEEVQEDLLQAIGRSQNAGQIVSEILDNLNVGGAEGMSNESKRFVNYVIDGDLLESRSART